MFFLLLAAFVLGGETYIVHGNNNMTNYVVFGADQKASYGESEARCHEIGCALVDIDSLELLEYITQNTLGPVFVRSFLGECFEGAVLYPGGHGAVYVPGADEDRLLGSVCEVSADDILPVLGGKAARSEKHGVKAAADGSLFLPLRTDISCCNCFPAETGELPL
ncbi:MAG: uncharacterized protein A8A55_2377 [Amphiamblys sp. WSBS2006]|nr:MAG: uncharacterized protein A8A55_2377 [Amphiamblys sp. WSBS2006]